MRTIKIPLQIINLQNNGFHLLMEIVVFGMPVLAVLDTGASHSVFDKLLMEKHLSNISKKCDAQANTIFCSVTTLSGVIESLYIGRLKIKNYEALSLSLQSVNDTYTLMGQPSISAIIGGDILQKYQAKIDYKKSLLTLYPSV